MSIVLPIFVLTTIVVSGYLNKRKMFIANKLYLVTFALIIFIFPFVNKNENVSDVISSILSRDIYECIDMALYNVDYIFTYMFIISFVTLVQVCITIHLLEKKIRKICSKNYDSYDDESKEEKNIFNEKQVEKKLSLNKVFIDYCRMIN